MISRCPACSPSKTPIVARNGAGQSSESEASEDTVEAELPGFLPRPFHGTRDRLQRGHGDQVAVRAEKAEQAALRHRVATDRAPRRLGALAHLSDPVATESEGRKMRHGEGERPPLLPWFVTAFAALVVFNSLVPIPELVRDAGNTASRWCLVAAIAALGVKTHFSEIVDIGWKPVVLMVLETIFIAGLALLVIWGGWL